MPAVCGRRGCVISLRAEAVGALERQRHVLVLTRNQSPVSLRRHRRDGWSLSNAELGDDLTPVPPQMRSGDSWSVGTADRIYRMDYAAMLQLRRDSGADLTVACLTVDLEQARVSGVMRVDANDQVVPFDEKPFQS